MDVRSIVGEEVHEADNVGVDQVLVKLDLALHLVLRRAAAREDLPVDDLVCVALVVYQLSHFVHLGEPALAYQSAPSVCNLKNKKSKLVKSFINLKEKYCKYPPYLTFI